MRDGRDFWSGQEWNEVVVGQGGHGGFTTPEAEEFIRQWDVDERMSLTNKNQRDIFDCGIACKKSVDDYYNATSQNSINSRYYNLAQSGGGLTNSQMLEMYRAGGYSGNLYSGDFSNQDALPWIVQEMRSNRVVQISARVSGSNPATYHASLIKRIRYLNDFSRVRIALMNPSSTIISRNNLGSYNNMFSIWR